ncbi:MULTISPECIES: radical SAM protein [unclassified Helicobacter]|uniref:radical SAM protein n=1 Tax=unclassified Helicobacter TaxID=2593540 RepID=UPI000CF0EDC3|nr:MULTISPECIES: radical SAM protein [unclassified Helicobacter]
MLEQNIIFGPIYSRRFGNSLGIDLSPSKKQCNFDCLYCELEAKKAQESMQDTIEVTTILKHLKNKLDSHIDVLTITANGEPTLYPHLYNLIFEIKKILPQNIKTLILSNGSRFGEKEVQKALLLFDIVKFSFDGADTKTFSRIDRPHHKINLENIKQGILEFSKIYNGDLIAEILLLKDINNSLENLQNLIDFLKQVKLKRIDLNTVDRPPAYSKAKPLDSQELNSIFLLFQKEIPHVKTTIPTRKDYDLQKITITTPNDLYHLIQKRPIEITEAQKILDTKAFVFLQDLLKDNKIITEEVNQLRFYRVRT